MLAPAPGMAPTTVPIRPERIAAGIDFMSRSKEGMARPTFSGIGVCSRCGSTFMISHSPNRPIRMAT